MPVQSSPRKRGCFLSAPATLSMPSVFPAQAGVFPCTCRARTYRRCLPRASGGVSRAQLSEAASAMSSPRKRGCFQLLPTFLTRSAVFPAQAGVFPAGSMSALRRARLPRASGGVSMVIPTEGFPVPVFPAQAGVFLSDVHRRLR